MPDIGIMVETPAAALTVDRLIGEVVSHGRASARDVSLCGDMTSDPACLPLVLSTGARKIPVLPAAFDRVKAAIRTIDRGGGRPSGPERVKLT